MTAERPHWWPVYVGIGSNLDDPIAHVRRAFDDLSVLRNTVLIAHSSLYRSEPVGPAGQPDYINAAASLMTRLNPADLLSALQGIEIAHGRERNGERWGPRTLDLDLLVYGRETADGPRLTLPHPRIAERNFVLLPLEEIAPELQVPGLMSVATLARNVDKTTPDIERLER